ncbi:MAG: hypothetical protein U5K69_16730 [Balneolaceae bacterium]|nr:hypothetical protein [Balneolaceae bacterium]
MVTKNTIVADLDAWLSKFNSNTSYNSVDIYINPYLKAYLDKGLFSIRLKWMLKYFIKINLIGEESISLNEYRVTLAGSDIEITDAVMRDEPIDELVQSSEAKLQELDSGKPKRENLDYYQKEDPKNGSGKRNGLPPRPGSNQATRPNSSSKSKYYKSDS